MLDAAWFTVNWPILTLKSSQLLSDDKIRESLLKQQKPAGLNLEPADLELLCRHSQKHAARLAGRLLAGSFPVQPAKLPGQPAPCDYCAFSALCLFDRQLGQWQHFGRLQGHSADGRRLTTRQVFLEKLRAEAGEDK